jgi:hypothetical protein
LGTPSEGSSSVIDCARAKIMKNYKKNYENYKNIENNSKTYEKI